MVQRVSVYFLIGALETDNLKVLKKNQIDAWQRQTTQMAIIQKGSNWVEVTGTIRHYMVRL